MKISIAECAGAATTLATWAAAAVTSERLEPRFGDEVGAFALLVGGFLGVWLYLVVRDKVAARLGKSP